MSKAESSDYNLKLNIYTCIYNKLVHVQSTHGTISTTLLSNTQSTYWVPKLKTEGQFEYAQVLYKGTCSKPLC